MSASSPPLAPVYIDLSAIWRMWVRVWRGKNSSQNQVGFDARWFDKPVFIRDSHVTLVSRDSYLAVDRLQAFMR